MRHPRFGWTARPLVGALMCTLTLAAGCGPAEGLDEAPAPELGEKQSEVVYGTDNRQDVYAHPNATLRLRAQQATVALMNPSDFNATNPNNVTFPGSTLGSSYNLCTTERFRDDPTAAFCSGTLIDDDLVLTAGHCVTSAADCTNTRLVFNYYRPAAGTLQPVTTADIFSCTSIVARQQATVNGQNLDFAVLRLDRAATPRFTPAPVRTGNTALTAGQNVAVIGSGSGIPFKIDSGGAVRDTRSGTLDYFIATTDTFGGNSGSGVYETSGYTVAGILVRGETDYVTSGSCRVVNVCTETGCRGEDVTYVFPAVRALCTATNNGSARLCTGLPPPPPPPANSYAYTATNTNSAQQNTVNKTLTFAAGDVVELGTCGVDGATLDGDSFLRLNNGAGTEVASNDDSCGGRGSYIKYTVPAAGSFTIRGGCYSSGSCGGTVVWKVTPGTPGGGGTSGSFAFNASNTNSAQQNTVNKDVTLAAGQVIKLGTCTVAGGSGTGDTYLRLYGPSGTQAAFNDDGSGCGTLSYLTYTVPAGAGGTYQVRAGCYSSNSCSGTVAYTIQ
ncbi:trypsin-like peptidase [Archangium gephyra]|uniref:Serine protease n=1 Tax=Archangium gephyra TaxID=48 RepID=A0AAC8TIJ1_9BACT|nr:serine protease [Archangium gephyra]AKJ07333.1 trypsin domain protein [Archangium gephyra]REG26736.1 trypsin-like peptidase [Archangium gephyra]